MWASVFFSLHGLRTFLDPIITPSSFTARHWNPLATALIPSQWYWSDWTVRPSTPVAGECEERSKNKYCSIGSIMEFSSCTLMRKLLFHRVPSPQGTEWNHHTPPLTSVGQNAGKSQREVILAASNDQQMCYRAYWQGSEATPVVYFMDALYLNKCKG